MNEAAPGPAPAAVPPPPPPPPAPVTSVHVRAYPKIVFFYPCFAMALIFAMIRGSVAPDSPMSRTLGLLFTAMLAFNMAIIAFEFTRMKVVVIVLALFALTCLFLWLGSAYDIEIFRTLSRWLKQIDIQMNTGFYVAMSVTFAFLFTGAFLVGRIDYWEITRNEVLHHHGLLGDVQRFPAPQVRFTKEIGDVLEFLLLRSGRLVLIFPDQTRPVVLDNVPGINRIETQLQMLLGSFSVTMEPARTTPGAA